MIDASDLLALTACAQPCRHCDLDLWPFRLKIDPYVTLTQSTFTSILGFLYLLSLKIGIGTRDRRGQQGRT